MLWAALLVSAVVAAAAAAWQLLCRQRARKQRLAEHRQRSRRIFGCLECGKEIVPPARLLRCGECREDTTLCLRCGPKCAFGQKHAHDEWHVDRVNLEVAWRVPSPLSLPNVLSESFRQWGERELLCDAADDGKWLSYAEVGRQVEAAGWHLVRELGLVPGDRVVLHAPSRPSFYLLQWACFRAGLVAVPVAERAPSEHVAQLIGLAEPRLVFSVIGNVAQGSYVLWGEQDLNRVVGARHRPLPIPRVAPDDLALLLPTSGTTGVPKLVCFTDAMMSRCASAVPKQGSDMVLLAYQPLRQAVDVLSKGGKIACCDWNGSLEGLLRAARRIRPTVFGGMPSLFSSLQSCGNNLNLLGNRVRTIVIGGARSSAEQKKWLFTRLSCVVLDGYGSTETGGLTLNGESGAEDLMLLDCPSLGYLTSDRPRPRGEIVSAIRPRTTPGYYKNEAATKECVVEIGGKRYWRTGDIGEKTESGIDVIDRMRNFFKLSNGLFVAPSQIETLFVQCASVAQCFVFAADDGESLVAAVVPRGAHSEQDILCGMRQMAAKHKLPPHEVPQRVLVDAEAWSEANGLLSSIGKVCRPMLAKRFHVASVRELPLPAICSSQLGSGVAQLVQETLGGLASDADTPLAVLGATSMNLAALQVVLRERFGAVVEVKQLAQLTVGELNALAFGDGAIEGRAKVDWMAEVESFAPNMCSNVLTFGKPLVFLTGASGFLGTFLLSELLRQTELDVLCLVRAANSVAAMERLRESFELYKLPQFDGSRVSVVVGSLDEPHLGLGSRDAFEQLARSRNFVVLHNGATVNSVLPYSALKWPNVGGTMQMIELAAGRPFHHISTIGMLSSSGTRDESEHVSPRALDVLSGYAQSKWVAEQLVLKWCRASVCHRVGSIAGSNPHDSINLLLRGVSLMGCVALECVPSSFPVIGCDFVAGGVVQLMSLAMSGKLEGRVFHFVSSDPLLPKDVFANVAQIEAHDFVAQVAAIQDPAHPLFFIRSSLAARKPSPLAAGPSDTATFRFSGRRAPPVSVEQLWRYALD